MEDSGGRDEETYRMLGLLPPTKRTPQEAIEKAIGHIKRSITVESVKAVHEPKPNDKTESTIPKVKPLIPSD